MVKDLDFQPQNNEEREARDLADFLQIMAISNDLKDPLLKKATRPEAMNELIDRARQLGKEIKLSDKDEATFRSLPDAPNLNEFITGFFKLTFGPEGSRGLDLPTD